MDQAEGLRRLLACKPFRVVSFVAGSRQVGKTSLLANLAVCLARMGQEVLIIDENSGKDDICAMFGLSSRYDLLHVLNQSRRIEDVVVRPTPGVSVLPAAMALSQIASLTAEQQVILVDAMQELETPVNVLLVDGSYEHPLGYSPLGLSTSETVLVLSAKENAIKEAYALVRKLSLAFSRRHFKLLVNKTQSEDNAKSIHENLAKVAKLNGLAKIDSAGRIPYDREWQSAAKINMPMITANPDSKASLAIRELAMDMLHWPTDEHVKGGVGRFMGKLLRVTERLSPVQQLATHV